MEKSSNLTNSALLLGGGTLLGGVGYLLYKNYYRKEENIEVVSIETTIRILKEFRRDFYPVFNNLAILSLRYQSQYQTGYSSIPESFFEKLESALSSENPMFLEQVEQLENEVYERHNITNRKQFESYCLKLSQKNSAVQSILNSIRVAYKDALRGKPEKYDAKLPEQLTPELVFTIYKKRVIEALSKILNTVDNYKRVHGTINVKDPEFNRELALITQSNDQHNIFQGYDVEFDEFIHPKLLFNQAITQFVKTNPQFSHNISLLEVKENGLMQKIIMSNTSYETLLAEIEAIMKIGEPVKPLIQELEPEIVSVQDNNNIEKQFIGDTKDSTKAILDSQFEKIEYDELSDKVGDMVDQIVEDNFENNQQDQNKELGEEDNLNPDEHQIVKEEEEKNTNEENGEN
jgi:hypothetical protein